ncbi:hypothetical protein Bbelb_103360 [Branchiostoma belcheri]|nr:hypothetical protein Bbelb_103360 [Branchiostoma belcheri]
MIPQPKQGPSHKLDYLIGICCDFCAQSCDCVVLGECTQAVHHSQRVENCRIGRHFLSESPRKCPGRDDARARIAGISAIMAGLRFRLGSPPQPGPAERPGRAANGGGFGVLARKICLAEERSGQGRMRRFYCAGAAAGKVSGNVPRCVRLRRQTWRDKQKTPARDSPHSRPVFRSFSPGFTTS